MRSVANKVSNYRPEIDGLRAVAIIPVVLFHSGVTLFGGGFVGVDVFFVISGFLITTFILNDLHAGRFSFIEFWIRRARRILPALFVVVVFSLLVGWFILFPGDYRDLGRSALSQSFFSSNVYFWLKSGYFAAPSETKPLLHTWSLSVEEQYYLVVPLFLFLLKKYLSRQSKSIVLVLMIFSFVASSLSSFIYPDAAFYLPHSRAWELLVGTWLAMAAADRLPKQEFNKTLRETSSVAGVIAIAFACVFFNQSTPFPGIAALVPCLGTAAIIWSNTGSRTQFGRVLSYKPLVFIGLISYSLYLWHWPLLAFARYWSPEELPLRVALGISAASIPIAWISYRYVETPFRRHIRFRRRMVMVPATAVGLLLMFGVGAWINTTGGVSWRPGFQSATFESDVTQPGKRERLCNAVISAQIEQDYVCRLGSVSNEKSKMLLVGDSFAEMYLGLFDRLSVTYDREVWFIRRQNVSVYPGIMQIIDEFNVSYVVLIYSWNKANQNGIPEISPKNTEAPRWVERFVEKRGFDPFQILRDTKSKFTSDLKTVAADLRKRNVGVSVIGAPPLYTVSVPLKLGILVKRNQDPELYGSLLSDHYASQRHIYEVFNELSSNGVQVIDVTDILCDKQGFCPTYQDGHSLYSDNAHLSEFGANKTMPLLRRIFSDVPTGGLK